MKPVLFFLAFLATFSLFGQRPVDALVKAERLFAASAAKDGLKTAFLGALSDESLVFRGTRFVPGKKFYAKVPDVSPFLLSWEPTYAEIAASGDLGFTTGPYDIRERVGSPPVSFGYFVSVWRKEPSGDWKNLLDLGISCPQTAPPEPLTTYEPPVGTGTLTELEDAEQRFIVAAKNSLSEAFRHVLTDHSRILVDGAEPYVGPAAGSYAGNRSVGVIYEPVRSVIASSGDFGYAYGYVPAEKGAYLRIWRKGKEGWKLALQVTAPGQ